ncbi:succinate dehydrogenase, hydrophobic membrane anchor protein [Sulfitobacter pseudonitzschiae]|uniref:Succinate dehydrogenase hydrophobic membrane anchor subunit n=1 Tax=Pseudosulfitobacter pseudonitzschiae TaxID=1402135 RepID=A0A9Q2RU74_9RHOB|nr:MULTISPECIES: succinate dehydrogenase, hydrophobic membrane anchor protein [Pseudosulfitobacter]MBM2291682.1 succinate dehydrogenase, hydrophobic membrane anchor protein [Pseudosulfitobacter pseudonitzschiae]MBM2296600.1 succinate dehydrogenase, hydrophobic membrane anchor protein [Pseudosulfitobacter pseudonitzschiae]MBM2301513.1 succinate dehydrogenase, hydrophobic membrane anchor protein [Pseudosulfitobacter pseudonitzschiae]MBM2311297.1 succinate dehydrogenase, hydrophobic membrane ancho|tara:strand:- start:434830 stop:435201 length:372 start_codon:yes stop_codon:yes gene_type:complete
MRYLTDRKRATGMGSAKSGTAHFWAMKVSAFALLILIPLFVFTFGPMLGKPHAEVLEYFSRPFPAIVAALTFAVTMKHFKDGVQVLIEDYVHGVAEKISIVVMICVCYAIAATGLFAIARIAL